MSDDQNFWDAVGRIRAKDDRFKPEAYAFTIDVLEFTFQSIGERRHVSALELLDGLRTHARRSYGPLAGDVLRDWGLRGPFDIGLVVFQLIEAGVLFRQESDRLEDFDIDLDFEKVFEEDYFDPR